jgi:transglutaminase superfamily protein
MSDSQTASKGNTGRQRQPVLEHFSEASSMSTPGRHARLLEPLAADPEELAHIIQGLLIYEHVAHDFYGVDLTADRKAESHIRPLERMLERLLALDAGPLKQPRPPERRLVGICRQYSLLMVGVLRHHGVPARVRFGFGTYFNPGYFEDHTVCEYWRKAENRWVMADPQFDDVWTSKLHIEHDVNDVPRDRFLTSANAWQMCRASRADPAKFGIYFGDLRGLWFVAGSVIRDAAALCKLEMLPWDVWGAQPQPGWSPEADELAFFDHLATLSSDPDASLDELRAMFDTDARVRVPPKVFNALTKHEENVRASPSA